VNISKRKPTETRIVSLQPGMYIVRFSAIPALGEGAILSIAPGDGGSRIDFFCSEGVKNNTLVNQSDIAVVRCGGGEGNLLVTSLSGSSRPVGVRVDRIAGATDLPGAGISGAPPQPGRPRQTAMEALGLAGHIEMLGDVRGRPGKWLGDPETARRLEGFTVEWANRPEDVDIAYSCMIDGLGRSPAVLSGGFCGSRRRAAAITALTVSLVGKNASAFELAMEAVFAGCPPQKMRSGVEVRGLAGREPLVALRAGIVRKS